ncbi:MAG: hypothetical protein RH949_14485 [Coleofasciculus sp. A1-SPW-01]|uniref:DUF4388 domain-containing protein n=1 Tax=Coleofasciculus sp. A1-SPW-01 TaxID=3070819 RepID=UPI0032F7669F
MSINGDLTDFFLDEIIKYLQISHKTGLLMLVYKTNHFFLLNKGCLVAASHRTDGLGLYSLILEVSLVKETTLKRVIDSAYNNSLPLGIFLHENGFLSVKTLKMLFEVQVIRELHIIEHEAKIGFSFDQCATIPNMELTGLKLPLDYLLCPNLYWTESTQNDVSRQPQKKIIAMAYD